ncbi:hypothetical protein ES332_A10G281200v1 [Gossypium tomentosum]|uniref:Uncharacterized protein n=1 Tax=Gossypium tomentosum TaxID=34277 RepID=A0A5D2NVS3_GOSTO|nr:hypothetical protein ES332_A10G281200v1 [Gossypium tomentosum]
MGGQGKTTLAETVFNEISSEFESRWFLQNVREKIEKRGKESLRNELFSKLLNSDVDIGTPSIGSTLTQERLKNKKLLVALDDVDDSDQIHCMGIKHFGYGSIIIITSRDRQVLKSGGADTILELNPPIHFQNLSRRFVMYTQGKMLNDGPPDEQILEVLKSSYDGLSELEKNIFLDIVCLFKGETIGKTKLILSNSYKGVECGIIKLVDKCLISVSSIPGVIDAMRIDIISQESKSLGEDSRLWCHDMLEEIGKDIVSQESKSPGERSRLWCHKDVDQILKYYKVRTDRIQGIKLDMSRMDILLFQLFVFENMINLRYIYFRFSSRSLPSSLQMDNVFLPDELRYLRWEYYPFKSLSSNFNLKNLTLLELPHGNMEQLWNEVLLLNLVNLREIDLTYCKNLRMLPNLSEAINLELLRCTGCESLVELWNEDGHSTGLVNLREIYFERCVNLRKISNLSRAIKLEILDCSNCESLVELWNEDDHMGLVNLRRICFDGCVNLRKIPNLSSAIKLQIFECSNCESLVELWNEDDHMSLVNLKEISCGGCVNLMKIPNISGAINLKLLHCYNCESLVELPCLNHLASLAELLLYGCSSLKKLPEVPCHFCSLNLSETGIEEVPDSIKNLHKLETLLLGKPQVKKVSIKLEFLRKLDLSGCPITELRFDSLCNLQHLNMSGSALPPYLEVLSVNDSKSLEKVSFADQNLNQFGSFENEFCRNPKFLMQFRNCFNLNQESTKNIEANAMLKIESLAKEWATTYARKNFRDYPQSLICCFPGNEILANNFKYRSLNSSLSLKIAPNGGSGSRFLVFAICLVANLAHRHYFLDRLFNCEYQLTAAGGGNGGSGCENFISKISFGSLFKLDTYMGYHVFILSSTDMVIEDKNYEEASFNFYIGHLDLNAAEGGFMELERCGVHVFYVDKKSDTDATEKRVAGNKRSFSHDGKEGGMEDLKD